MSDILERLAKEKIDRIRKNGESFHEWYLYCPYCAYEQTELWEGFDLQPNGEDREGQCQSCERHFFYKVEFSFSSRQSK